MKGTRGFTLVELMAAAMLAGAVLLTALPLMLMAQRTARRLSGETAAAMRGDAVFELAAGELRYAKSVSLYRFQKSRGTASMGIRSGAFPMWRSGSGQQEKEASG